MLIQIFPHILKTNSYPITHLATCSLQLCQVSLNHKNITDFLKKFFITKDENRGKSLSEEFIRKQDIRTFDCLSYKVNWKYQDNFKLQKHVSFPNKADLL